MARKYFVGGIVALALMASAGVAAAQNANSNTSGSQSGASSNVTMNSSRGYKGTGGAFAPGLAAGGITCQGSASAGAGGPGWAIAFGTTKMDKDCNTRANAALAGSIAGREAAKEVACFIDEIHKALNSLGIGCRVRGDNVGTARYAPAGRRAAQAQTVSNRRAANNNSALARCQKRQLTDASVRCTVYGG